jgi:CubicO group peptidase (beta-lactamase class C family)
MTGEMSSRVGSSGVRRPRRRWLRRLATGAAAFLVVVLVLYGWAWLSLDRSSIARAILWMDSDVDDQHRFPARLILADDSATPLPAADEMFVPAVPDVAGRGGSFDKLLRDTDTHAFLVAHSDRVLYERYLAPSDRESLETSFSVAKSFLSTLLGMAIDEGLIGSVEDPVTDYLPELTARDPRFERITLSHMLSMSSGLRYREQEFPLPWGDDIETYYGTDLRDIALTETEVDRPPGQEWLYNNYNPLLLGMVLERATGMSVSDYMATRLWQPLGAERDATWSLDSERSGFEKMESGLNATAVDYARFGLLFLNDGVWSDTRIVSEEWVRAATTPYLHSYGYFWWVDAERPGRFYALGKYGQYIYVAPDADTVVVRLGRDWGVDNDTWLAIFRDIAHQLTQGG